MDDIDKMVKASIETKIIEAFRKSPEYIDDLVKAVLHREVDETGSEPRYGIGKMPYLTWLARDAVQCVASNAVRDYVVELEPKIKESVKTALTSDAIVDAFTKHILGASSEGWAIKVEFQTK